jgi:hypothetical protein
VLDAFLRWFVELLQQDYAKLIETLSFDNVDEFLKKSNYSIV